MPTRWLCPPPPSPAGGSAARRRSGGRTWRRWAAPAGRSLWSVSAAAKLMTGYWRPPMPRLASLYFPALPIDRIRRSEGRERNVERPHKAPPLDGGGLGGGGLFADNERVCESTPPQTPPHQGEGVS